MNLQNFFSGILFCISITALIIACLAFTRNKSGEYYKKPAKPPLNMPPPTPPPPPPTPPPPAMGGWCCLDFDDLVDFGYPNGPPAKCTDLEKTATAAAEKVDAAQKAYSKCFHIYPPNKPCTPEEVNALANALADAKALAEKAQNAYEAACNAGPCKKDDCTECGSCSWRTSAHPCLGTWFPKVDSSGGRAILLPGPGQREWRPN